MTAFADLSKLQGLALIDLVSRFGLYRTHSGYFGELYHQHGTMQSLENRGLCKIRPHGRLGSAEPTMLGRKLLLDHFGDVPMIVDSTPTIKRKKTR